MRLLQGRQFTERSLPINSADESIIRSTKKKLENVLSTISLLKAEDFPHGHSSDALTALEKMFGARRKSVELLTEKNDLSVVKSVCKEANETLGIFLPLLGFIVRSTHVRNAFELHRPVLRLVHKALGESAKLILSSEWLFSPFTYLLPPLDERRYVMIGLPASESGNGLIIPLAGHELGHSIWVQQNLAAKYSTIIEDKIVEIITTSKWEEFQQHSSISDKSQVNDLIGRSYWTYAYQLSTSQCEELFCDFIGVNIFGSSYLYAFGYLLAPGLGQDRVEHYPSIVARASALEKASAVVSSPVPPDFTKQFVEPTPPSKDFRGFLLTLSDAVTDSLLNALIDEAFTFCRDHGLIQATSRDINSIVKSFDNLVPANGAQSLASIINAGWQVYSNLGPTWPASYAQLNNDPAKQHVVLNDLVLKTVEVYEIEQRQNKQ